ncbi:MAG: flavodoxin family protein [Deltaproteobacteria bacterium]|nr:flavodoxin family protein [Deltaproteobacteria bacterium]
MKVVCLLGSPRSKSNSSAIAKRFIDTIQKLGAETKTYTLNKLKYRGCQACMGCKTKHEKCVLKDDLAEVLDAVQQSDVLVMASPVYFGEVSSQLKGFIDRMFSFLKPDYATNPNPVRLTPGMTLIMALTQGEADENLFSDIFPRYDYFMKWYGFKESYLIRACGVRDAGDIESRQEVLEQAEEIARKVYSA